MRTTDIETSLEILSQAVGDEKSSLALQLRLGYRGWERTTGLWLQVQDLVPKVNDRLTDHDSLHQ